MQAGRWRDAAELFAQMQAGRIEPTVKTYTTLIKACTAAGAPDRAIAFFAQMEAAGVRADLLAYNSLMGAFSRSGDWERAWSVLGAMRRAGVDPDIVSFNTLLKACERCGRPAVCPRAACTAHARMQRSMSQAYRCCDATWRMMALVAELRDGVLCCDVLYGSTIKRMETQPRSPRGRVLCGACCMAMVLYRHLCPP